MDNPKETAIPMDRLLIMARWEIAPPVICSTYLLSTSTAGSAFTMKYPMTIARGMRIQR